MPDISGDVLGTYLDFRNGKTSPARSISGRYPVYGSNGVIGFADQCNAEAGSIVIGRVGTYCGSLHYSRSPAWVTDNALVCVAPPREERFWFYALKSLHLNNFRAGSGQPLLNQSILKQLKFVAPGKAERNAIGSVLGALDDKADINREIKKTCEALEQILFEDWFVTFGPTRAKTAQLPPYLSEPVWKQFPSALDEEGKPSGWHNRLVKDFADLKGGKQLEKARIALSGDSPVFGGAGIMGYTDRSNASGYVITVGRVGAYCGQFFSHRGAAWINNNASLIHPHPDVCGEWLFQALKNADIDKIKKGAAQPFISNGDLANLSIIWPGKCLVDSYAQLVMPLLHLSENSQKEIAKLFEMRDFLLPRLFSGSLFLKDAEKLAGEAL